MSGAGNDIELPGTSKQGVSLTVQFQDDLVVPPTISSVGAVT